MKKTPKKDLLEELKNIEFAKLYGAESAKMDFAVTLLKARENANLTQKEFAAKLGISQPYIAKLESGEANPTLGTIGSIMAMLGLRLVTNTNALSPEPEEVPANNNVPHVESRTITQETTIIRNNEVASLRA